MLREPRRIAQRSGDRLFRKKKPRPGAGLHQADLAKQAKLDITIISRMENYQRKTFARFGGSNLRAAHNAERRVHQRQAAA